MPKPRPSVLKRQREQAKKDRKVAKAEKKAQRTSDDDMIEDVVVRETPVDLDEVDSVVRN